MSIRRSEETSEKHKKAILGVGAFVALDARSSQAQSSTQENLTLRKPRFRSACVGKRTFVAFTSSPSPSQRAIEPPRARSSASRTA